MSVSNLSRPRSRLIAALLAVSLPLGASPAQAASLTASAPLALLAGKVTAEQASSARKPVQEKAQGLLKAGNSESAAEMLSEEAGKRSDPVLYLDAADAYREAGVEAKSKADIETGIERARIGLDILHFLQDPRCDPDWQVVASDDVAAEISRGEKIISASEEALENLNKKADKAVASSDEPKEEKKARKKAPKDGRGLIAAGSLLTLVGVGGLGLMGAGLATGAGAQKDIDALATKLKAGEITQAEFDMQQGDIDDKGKRGNVLTYAGIGVGAVGLAAGIALLVIGVKKRKKYRAENGGGEDSTAMVMPSLGRDHAGLVFVGRF